MYSHLGCSFSRFIPIQQPICSGCHGIKGCDTSTWVNIYRSVYREADCAKFPTGSVSMTWFDNTSDNDIPLSSWRFVDEYLNANPVRAKSLMRQVMFISILSTGFCGLNLDYLTSAHGYELLWIITNPWIWLIYHTILRWGGNETSIDDLITYDDINPFFFLVLQDFGDHNDRNDQYYGQKYVWSDSSIWSKS